MIIQSNKIGTFSNVENLVLTNSWFLKSGKDEGSLSSYIVSGDTVYQKYKDKIQSSSFNFTGNWNVLSGGLYNVGSLDENASLSSAATISWCMVNLVSELNKLSEQLFGDQNQKLPSYVGQVIITRDLSTETMVKNKFGGNRWQKIEGRFLLGTGPNEPNTSQKYGNCLYGEMNVTAPRKTGGTTAVPLQTKNIPGHSHVVGNMRWKELPAGEVSMRLGVGGEAGEYGVIPNGNLIAKETVGHQINHKHRHGLHKAFKGGIKPGSGSNYADPASVKTVKEVTGEGDISKNFTFTPKATVDPMGGNGQVHYNMPPYVVEYIWERME